MTAPRLLLLLASLAVGALGGVPAAQAAAPAPCPQELWVLLDRSASMADHDPFGALRLGVAASLAAARPARGDEVVVPFDVRAHEPVPAAEQGWEAAVERAMAGGDRGPTALAEALATLPPGASRALVVITDPEVVLDPVVARSHGVAVVVTVGGPPSAGLRRAAAAGGAQAIGAADAAEARRVGASLCRAAPVQQTGVAVLLAGLRQTTTQVRAARSVHACAAARSLAWWCSALVADGWSVWVPSAAPSRRGGALLDSTGRLDGNATALRRWLADGPGRTGLPPILIGHSMGGLIAHAAVRSGAPAAGLLTVGTPHAGSFGADAYYAARAAAAGCLLACPITAAHLTVAASIVRRRFGAALDELTRLQRTRWAPLGQPAVPLATWAGVTSHAAVLPAGLPLAGASRTDYVTPNDGIVGRGSATGRLARLAPVATVDDGAARHSSSVPPRSAPTELEAPAVRRWLVAMAQRLQTGGGYEGSASASRAVVAPPRRGPTAPRPAALRARRVTASLRSVTPLTAGDVALPVESQAVVVATAPVGVVCDGQSTAAVQVAPGLWYLDVGAMGCAAVSVAAAPSASPALVIGARQAEGRLPEQITAQRRRAGGWRLRLVLHEQGRPRVLRSGRSVQLRRVAGTEWALSRQWMADLGPRGGRTITVGVRAPGRAPRVASLPLP